jgi:hypothetical protein
MMESASVPARYSDSSFEKRKLQPDGIESARAQVTLGWNEMSASVSSASALAHQQVAALNPSPTERNPTTLSRSAMQIVSSAWLRLASGRAALVPARRPDPVRAPAVVAAGDDVAGRAPRPGPRRAPDRRPKGSRH